MTFVLDLDRIVILFTASGSVDCQNANHRLLGSYHEIGHLPGVVTPIHTILTGSSCGQGVKGRLQCWFNCQGDIFSGKMVELQFKTS